MADEAARLKAGQTLISFLYPAQNTAMLQQLTTLGVTAMAMDSIPRISRAQKVDALSSMANIAGYRAVLSAAGAGPGAELAGFLLRVGRGLKAVRHLALVERSRAPREVAAGKPTAGYFFAAASRPVMRRSATALTSGSTDKLLGARP